MKKIVFLFYFCSCFALHLYSLDVDLESEVAYLMNVDNQAVLYQKKVNEPIIPASITKIATALFALKEVGEDLDVEIEADQDCIGSITAEMQKTMNYNHPPYWQIIGGTHMGIHRGERLTLEELLYGMMLVSANDASNVVAKYVSGTIPQFVSDLNDYLEEIGCKNTHFLNPHGLHFPNHYTTVEDMALITSEALKYPMFRKIVLTQKRGNLKNLNFLVNEGSEYYYPYAIGVKTGGHSDAGQTLVAAAEYQGRTLVAVLAKCPTKPGKFVDAQKLFRAAFQEPLTQELYLEEGPQLFKYKIEGIKKPLKTSLESSVELSYYPSEKPQVKGTIYWHPPALPIHKGDIVADLVLKDERGNLLKEVPLVAQCRVAPSKSKLWKALIGLGTFSLLVLVAMRLTRA